MKEDYKLLETMNKMTMQKYSLYRQIASDVGKQILELNEKCNQKFLIQFHSVIIYLLKNSNFIYLLIYSYYLDKSLEPYLSQIDQIEDSVLKLEQAAFKLDAYAKRLEAKYKSLEKRQ